MGYRLIKFERVDWMIVACMVIFIVCVWVAFGIAGM